MCTRTSTSCFRPVTRSNERGKPRGRVITTRPRCVWRRAATRVQRERPTTPNIPMLARPTERASYREQPNPMFARRALGRSSLHEPDLLGEAARRATWSAPGARSRSEASARSDKSPSIISAEWPPERRLPRQHPGALGMAPSPRPFPTRSHSSDSCWDCSKPPRERE